MERRIESWYGSALIELLAVVLIAIPFGLGVGHASGRMLASLITSLAISSTIYVLLNLDFRFIHPRFRKLSPDRQVVMETIAGFLEHVVGAWLAFSVCISVSDSNPSSCVPNPPGKRAIACDSMTKRSLRVKKYLKVISFGSSTMYSLAPCSNGRWIFTPKLFPVPAPSFPAFIIPSAAPVITIYPAFDNNRANLTAAL